MIFNLESQIYLPIWACHTCTKAEKCQIMDLIIILRVYYYTKEQMTAKQLMFDYMYIHKSSRVQGLVSFLLPWLHLVKLHIDLATIKVGIIKHGYRERGRVIGYE